MAGKKKTTKKRKKISSERKLERELLWIIGFMVFLVILFLVVNSFFKSLSQFEYEGLTFTKTEINGITFYHYYYLFEGDKGAIFRYNLYLRTDPRENSVPYEGDSVLLDEKSVYVGVRTSGFDECPKTAAAIATLSGFLTDNQFRVFGGNTNAVEATINNERHVSCKARPDDNVIEIRRGDETKVVGNITDDGNCYQIFVGPQCNTLEAVERFELQTILDARELDAEE